MAENWEVGSFMLPSRDATQESSTALHFYVVRCEIENMKVSVKMTHKGLLCVFISHVDDGKI